MKYPDQKIKVLWIHTLNRHLSEVDKAIIKESKSILVEYYRLKISNCYRGSCKNLEISKLASLETGHHICYA